VFSPAFSKDKTIFLGTWNGVYRSTDDGESWEQMLDIARFDVVSRRISFIGNWSAASSVFCSGGNYCFARETGAVVEFLFVGKKIKWIGQTANTGGLAHVYLDGEFVKEVDLYDSRRYMSWQKVLWETEVEETLKPHILRIEVTGTSSPGSQGVDVFVDAIEIEYTPKQPREL